VPDAQVFSRTVSGHHGAVVATAGRAGIPLRGVSAVLVSVHAMNPAADGDLALWRTGRRAPRRAAAVSFGSHRPAADTLLVPVSSTGRFSLRNNAAGHVDVQVDVRGYVPAEAVPGTSGSSGARYLEALVDRRKDSNYLADDEQKMNDYGCLDAENGISFELLDVGAQSVSTPQLSPSKPGVALALAPGKPVRLRYPDLQQVLESYVDGFRSASCNAAQLPLTLAEAAFASTEKQAETWESAFLNGTPSTLIENGDANDCPVTFVSGRTCAYDWTEQQYYDLASRGDRIEALPQIFYPTDAVKWADIDATGGGGITFVGSLTEHARDSTQFSPESGRTARYRALSSVVAAPKLPYAVDI
jgi:hypothetical protein